MTTTRPITLLVCALGGEGGGVLTEWLVETARIAGYPAQATSIPGVAQRTGATTYYLEVFPVPLAQLGGRHPVFGLSPVPGALDALVSSELLETARQVTAGMASPDRTLVISSTARLLTTQERMQLGDGRADAAELLQLVQAFSREHQVFDMGAMAKEAGTVVSAVLLGAIAGSGLLPFERRHFEQAVRGGAPADQASGMARASLRGFDKACALVQGRQTQAAFVAQLLAPEQATAGPAPATGPTAAAVPASAPAFPEPVREMYVLGHARLVEYQGTPYADLYTQRLQSVLAAERQADPAGAHGFAITAEMARWLALWMAFDDIVRVADLKSRASRWQRVQREVKPAEADLLKVFDHFKPGIPEFAALLPAGPAERVLAWDRRRVAAGREPWALPLKVGTHTAFGMLALRTLASLKWLRVRGSRFALEQQMIARWLDGVLQGSRRDWRLGHEIALCGRLIKGYGATNERGKENLLHVLDHLAHGPDAAAAARAVAAARQAALADDAGKALDATLLQHGAPARPVKAVPIRWSRTPRGLAAGTAKAP
ncbi:MAG TPA: indolepyruvate oxidoreductase subunit beta family protein [Ramlibacter sp.]|jgi:indolepyruvate ferredoxin oxidoreductase beta subunit|uniref:indolepyruvate oxidoreductase subunit beta family protein n=1 Tax=Ramlibacter sp. TaxID=1917967 RepID=UPI002D63DBAA|nr:indolepyruvate oxidoreductase subunit beta family protein [Ramlibacter sp.]HZY20027.1 indolepyruvate oxidoreductase subunit beta family protein [Ramlibacter sp.]